jgi:hypothetical protein
MPETNPLPDHMRIGESLRFRAIFRGIINILLCVGKIMRKCDLYYDARYRIIKNVSKGIGNALASPMPCLEIVS